MEIEKIKEVGKIRATGQIREVAKIREIEKIREIDETIPIAKIREDDDFIEHYEKATRPTSGLPIEEYFFIFKFLFAAA